MDSAILFSIFLLSLLQIIFFITRVRKGSKKNVPPGSLGIPIVGQSIGFIKALRTDTAEEWLQKRRQKYGPISKLTLFGTPTIFLTGPAANKFLFTNDGSALTNHQPASVRRMLGDRNLTELSKEDHKRVRGAIGLFLKPEVLKKYVGKMDGLVRQHIQMDWNGRQEVKVFPLVKALTFDIVSSFLFGLEKGVETEKLLKDFDDFGLGTWAVPINLPFTRFNRGIRASRKIRQLVKRLIIEKRLALAQGRASREDDLITCLLSIYGEDNREEMITEKEILDNVIVVMFAGHETSTSLITLLIQLLSKNPAIYESVLHEQEEIALSKDPAKPLTWDDLAKMKITWRAAMETLRIIPPVFGMFRKAVQDFEYEGYLIPKGWQVFCASCTTHMDEQIFPDPWKFDPTRYENQASVPPYSLVPFGGGMRICPGYEFAKMETLITMHYIITGFTWEMCCTDERVTRNSMPMPSQGLPIRIKPKLM